jgi:hypothetical protein
LRKFANSINYKIKVNPLYLEKLLAAGNPNQKIRPIHVTHNPKITRYSPYDHSKAPFFLFLVSVLSYVSPFA